MMLLAQEEMTKAAPRVTTKSSTGLARASVVVALLALLVLLASGSARAAEDGPVPPCDGAPDPAYPAMGDAPRVQVLLRGNLDHWHPPDCTPWLPPHPAMLIALAGRFQSLAGPDAILERFGAVSGLLTVRYWSTTDGRWQNLFIRAAALDGPDAARPRADFTSDELRTGRDFYFMQEDNRSTGAVIYRMAVHGRGDKKFIVEMENVAPLNFLFIPLYAAGSLRSTFFLQQPNATSWDYYSLMSVRSETSSLASEKSYVNRAVALFRHVAGVPTDQEPPAAP